MKTTRNLLLGLLLLTGVPLAASAQISVSAGISIGPGGRSSVDLGFFYDNLASYGNWIQRPTYGWVWTPRSVASSWRPYQDGRWVWTDQGWTWISDEPYGWATYHYGRWYEDPDLGWSWVPGDQWAPAWVDWQEGDDYVGWAPLPPSYDINGGYGSGYRLAPESYVFVQERNFLAPQIVTYVLPPQQAVTIFGRTRNYTNYRVSNNLVINQGIPVDRIQRVVGRSVPRYQVADLGATEARQRTARISGNRVEIFRPQVQRNVQVTPPASRPAARRSVVTATEFQQRNPNQAQRANRAARPPQVQGTTAPNPTIQGQRRQQQPATQGRQGQTQAERRRPPQVQPQAQPERQRRNSTPAVQAQPRNPQREQAQRPPQRQQPQPQVQPQPNRGNPGAQGPKNNNDNQRGKAKPQKDKKKDKDRNRDQGPPPPQR
jgi:hypothetical protein